MKDVFLETDRLVLRFMNHGDYSDIAEMLQDAEVMYAWEKTFDDMEVCGWINKMCARYKNDGYGYFLAVDKNLNQAVGQIGLLSEEIGREKFVGVGYMLKRRYFGCGYAAEGAAGCLDYAFNVLKTDRVIADIRPSNGASRHVAEKLGMKAAGSFIKHYDGKDMEHIVYELKSPLRREIVLKNLGRVVLRPAVPSDAAGLVEYAEAISSESDNLTYGPGEFGIGAGEEEGFLKSICLQRNSIYVVAVDSQDRIIGSLSFAGGRRPRVAHTGEFGVSVLKKYWGLGLGRKLLEYIVEWSKITGIIRKINLQVRSDNCRAIALYESAGFRSEGCISRGLMVGGKFYDLIHMGLDID